MAAIRLKNGLVIGEGMPKICVPLVAAQQAVLLDELAEALAVGADLIEWRADRFESYKEPTCVLQVLAALQEAVGDTPLLFTLRSKLEGGKSCLKPEEAGALLCAVAQSGLAALVDVELALGEAVFGAVVEAAHGEGAIVVASSHDFDKTPESGEMLRRLQAMKAQGADIQKLAVMPNSRADVVRLLDVTQQVAGNGGLPVTMAMGPLGAITRVAGESFGSVFTFGAGRAASAPGQLAAVPLRGVLEVLHGALE